jgi:hypothetical protein
MSAEVAIGVPSSRTLATSQVVAHSYARPAPRSQRHTGTSRRRRTRCRRARFGRGSGPPATAIVADSQGIPSLDRREQTAEQTRRICTGRKGGNGAGLLAGVVGRAVRRRMEGGAKRTTFLGESGPESRTAGVGHDAREGRRMSSFLGSSLRAPTWPSDRHLVGAAYGLPIPGWPGTIATMRWDVMAGWPSRWG